MTPMYRKTKETEITCSIKEKGGPSRIITPIPFFNHMLESFSYYAQLTLDIEAKGDLEVDDHHLVEDCGIVIGTALRTLIQEKKGYKRFSSVYTAMDESLSRVVIDISNRPYLVFDAQFSQDRIGLLSLQNVKEFFKAFAFEARITLHIAQLYGDNDHHKVESIFKACGQALAIALEETQSVISTKGVL